MIQALLIGLIGALGVMDYQMGTLYIFRPIVLGTITGAVLGDVQQGLIIGATLELFFLGAVSIGAYIPPDVIVGGVLATAFAITTGSGAEVAVTLAMPIALVSSAVGNLLDVVSPLILRIADQAATEGDDKKIVAVHWILGLLNVGRRFFLIFFAYWIGVEQVSKLLDILPQQIIDGMGAAAGLLPALGLAMLMKMILNKRVLPYYFLGFALAAFFNASTLAVAVLGTILVIGKFGFNEGKLSMNNNTAVGGDEDDF